MLLCAGHSVIGGAHWSAAQIAQKPARAFSLATNLNSLASEKSLRLVSVTSGDGVFHFCGGFERRLLWQFFCIADTTLGYSSADSDVIFTLEDVEKGLLDVNGWTVLLKETGEIVGIVDEVLHIGRPGSDEIFESVLKLVNFVGQPDKDFEYQLSMSDDSEEQDCVEFLVPIVEDIVREVDFNNRSLYITPPSGLLELARIPDLLRCLRPKLLEFCRKQNEGIRGCLDIARASKGSRFSDDARRMMAWSGSSENERLDVFMPTRRQLLAAGRHDLVDDIMAAGGFPSVAEALKLRSRRRPNGFWEDLRNLDAEIEWFVSGSWARQEDQVTGELYYFNLATNEVSSEEPFPGSVSDPIPVSMDSFDVGTAIMPRRRKVLDAGRYDLHHAIMMHGGYKMVAQQLGRQTISKTTTSLILQKFRSFVEEQSMSHFPSFQELKSSGRSDLVYALQKHGGVNALADILDLRPKRYGKGQWRHLEVAAAAIRTYLCTKLIEERGLSVSSMDHFDLENMVWKDALEAGILVIPTQSSAQKDGRSDIRYILQKFGAEELCKYLGISRAVRVSRRNDVPPCSEK